MTDEMDVFALPGVDDLFAVELAEFVARRDALVKELKKAGDKAGAAAVKALRKPSAVAWAVNQVVRREPDDVTALITAGQAARDAQAKAVQGKDDGGLRTAARDWRARIQSLATAAARLAGDQYRDDAAATFEAASADGGLAEVLKAGRLVAAIEPSGFGLAGMPDPPERAPREHFEPEPVAVADEPAPAEPAPVVDEAAVKRLAGREAALEKATHRLRRAEQRLDVARQAVEEANAARDEALAARDEAASQLG